MKQELRSKPEILANGDVAFATRPRIALTCPHCWTEQRAERSRCYRCGAGFIYWDEQDQQEAPHRQAI